MIKPIFKRLQIPRINTGKFLMNPVELKDFIDFEPKRIYYITKPGGDTSAHCHMVERELFIMLTGSCTAVIDQGQGKQEMPLHGSDAADSSPSDALYVGNYVWHYFKDFAPNSVLLAVSSTNYNPDRSDYILDYQTYQATIQKLLHE